MEDITSFLFYAIISLIILGIFIFLFPVVIGSFVIDWVGNFTNSHLVWLFMWFFLAGVAFVLTVLFGVIGLSPLSLIFTIATTLFLVFGVWHSVETYRGNFDYQEQYEAFENWDYREVMSGN